MFKVEEGGVSTPIKWGKENIISDGSIIILDEENLKLWLWHGKKQNLVSRRVALRQAESLKGHGYQIGKSILGRDIKELVEIDERRIGMDPETDAAYEEFQKLLNREYQEIGDNIITFTIVGEVKPLEVVPSPELATSTLPKSIEKPIVEPTPEPKVEPVREELRVISSAPEYSTKTEISKVREPETKPSVAVSPQPAVPEPTTPKIQLSISDARIGFVLISILEEFNDIWASKKENGTIAVEIMDGPVCEFKIEGINVKFSANSFKGIDPQKKIAIQARFVELSKMLK